MLFEIRFFGPGLFQGGAAEDHHPEEMGSGRWKLLNNHIPASGRKTLGQRPRLGVTGKRSHLDIKISLIKICMFENPGSG
jgi:hypothetical protein